MDKLTSYKKNYFITLQFGFIVALLIAGTVFNLQFEREIPLDPEIDLQRDITLLIDVPITMQADKPAPPARPSLEPVPDTPEIIDDIIDDLQLPHMDDFENFTPPPYGDEPGDYPDDHIFEAVEIMPEIVGGLAALYGEINYPSTARATGIQGTVVLEFRVDQSGNVSDILVVRGVHPLLDEEAIRAVSTMQFTPGIQQGRPVNVRMTQQIRFRLQ